MSAHISPPFIRLLLLSVLTLSLFAVAVPVQAQDIETLPLAERGPYLVGTIETTYTDETRDGREVAVAIWYPAAEEVDNAAADPAAAPYPLILYTIGMTGNRHGLSYFTEHLASHGFVVAAMDRAGHALFSYRETVDEPLDVLFVLDRLAETPPSELIGMIDADRTGVTGYSFGGYTSVAVSGAQWDDLYHQRWCDEHRGEYPPGCPGTEVNDIVVTYRAQYEPLPDVGALWPPMTDERIRAVLPMGGVPGMVFGERGLAEADVPMMMMAATEDTDAPYVPTSAFVYEHWSDVDHYLLSFVGLRQTFGYTSVTPEIRSEIQHFAMAFFGHYLQGQEEYADYLTEDYVNAIDGLYWGVYSQ